MVDEVQTEEELKTEEPESVEAVEAMEPAPIEAEPLAVYQEKLPTVEAIQFSGENAEEITKFVGKEYGKDAGEEGYRLTPQGKDPRGAKISVGAGQWVVKSPTAGLAVVNDGDFRARYEKTDKEVSEQPPEVEPKPVEPAEPPQTQQGEAV